MRKTLLMGLLCAGMCLAPAHIFAQARASARVVSAEDSLPLPGAVVKVQGTSRVAVTDGDGRFEFTLGAGEYTLEFSMLGYLGKEDLVGFPWEGMRVFALEQESYGLEEVEVLSTGYQQLPKERATGSFVHVDRELVERRVSTGILERLEDVTSGLIFNRRGGPGDQINIRGRSTLFANSQPLIIVDNFPYDGDIQNINPNDVESITVLRDAAAASIWGAQAGNGVIVITTKMGRKGQQPTVSINSNSTFGERPDAFYQPMMSTSEVIGMERELFGRNYYNNQLTNINRPPLTPGVEALFEHRDGLISDSELEGRLSGYGAHDVRSDFDRYFYRPSHLQQYAASVSGGSDYHSYLFSAGYDRNRESLVANENSRISLQARNDWKLLNGRMGIHTTVYYTKATRERGNEGVENVFFNGANPVYAYARMADEAGNPLPVIRDHRTGYKLEAERNGLLNWDYVPLDEIGRNPLVSNSDDLRINSGLSYRVTPDLMAEVQYQYWANRDNTEQHLAYDSYFTRNLINRYTQVDPQGNLTFPIPRTGILDVGNQRAQTHNVRANLRYHRVIGEKHELNALGGIELKDYQLLGSNGRYYGYNPNLTASVPMDFLTRYPMYYNNGSLQAVPFRGGLTDLVDRFYSYYGNLAYNFDRRFDLTVSARRDQSNLFGVDANQRGVPLYSAGAGWLLSNENFYRWEAMPYLKLRSSFGFNGNVDKSLAAETTAIYLTGPGSSINPGLPYGRILNPPNPDLRWERIRIINLGLDFESRSGRVGGNVEYYWKEGLDLIGDAMMPSSSGVSQFRGNTARTSAEGLDLVLNTRNLVGQFGWNSTFLLSTNREIVKEYLLEAPLNNILANGEGTSGLVAPVEGRPLFSLFSYRWAGLDPDTGNPRGYLDGEASSNYVGIINNTAVEDLIYHGSARPTLFGALRNDFSYAGFTLSVNISYRMGYFYRRESVLYNQVLTGTRGHGDFGLRWQAPGDELRTDVPSLPMGANLNRDNVYRFSEVLVERGDHIRLQDVNLTYDLPVGRWNLPVSRVQTYVYANNLGILWKASDDPLDPDFRSMRPLRSVSLGARIDF
ncbi:SusC/RagA family TonB-linked outer membrane protein [Litoribacter alkaliphilus]|uniref:SusC/RagA family TonB-linked outer membrane protein n=1 Tax=Litoribacter ruber TaxID=702568 RepID=A0AAP2CMB7_9BACT|nr:SusC/RagA family TonB-linked outer membrane protein [Litoribacter alkaliphilus]MBS9525971.1 SusC/RagA family TonB-linked outer membrane protein [Litoribacter alkaliphilus]